MRATLRISTPSFSACLWLIAVTAVAARVHAAESWAGRRLSSVLDQLRAAGLPLLYSSQVVGDDLVIKQEPTAVVQLERLRQSLQQLGLELKALEPPGVGYAVVRSASAGVTETTPASSTFIDGITISASRYNLSREDSAAASTSISHATLEKTAGIEQDVLRSVQYLPGASGNGLSALTHVRGSYEDENLVRFDGVELYKPVHLKDYQGLFGLLDPDWVESLQFYSGAYPVQFGNHTAAVIDMQPRRLDQRTFIAGGSLLYTRLFGAGSYADGNGHWLMGYRRSNVAEILSHTENEVGHPEFEDLVVRFSHSFAPGELRVGALRLNDDLHLQTNSLNEHAQSNDHDSYLWAGWRSSPLPELDYEVQLSHAQLSSRRSARQSHPNISSGELEDRHAARLFTLDAGFNLRAGAQTQLRWGLHANRTQAAHGHFNTAQYLPPLAQTFGKPANAGSDYALQLDEWDYAGYIALAHSRDAWRGELGLRRDVFPHLSHGTQLSPRLSLQYTLNADSTLHASAGNYVQAPSLLLDNGSLDSSKQPERMRQYILGWTRSLSPSTQLRIEAYHKQGSRLAARSHNLLSFISLAGELEIDRVVIQPTRSRAQGLEISLSAPAQQDFGWWLSYSWSRVQDQIDGAYYRRSWDQPHALNVGANWTRARWLLSGNFAWHSGWTYTPLLLDDDAGSATLGRRNSRRFSNFASLELRAQYTMPMATGELQWFLELRNALNRDNECCRALSVDSSGGAPRIDIEDEAALPVIPVAGFNLRF